MSLWALEAGIMFGPITFRPYVRKPKRGMKRNRRMRREGRAKSRRNETRLYVTAVDHANRTITFSTRNPLDP